MENKPFDYVVNSDFKNITGFNYRFAKDFDVKEIFLILKDLYIKDGGLEELFE